MTGTSDLRAEHVGVARMLRVMDAMAARLRAGRAVPREDFASSLEFLRVFVDQCHHSKEEICLFPALRTAHASPVNDILPLLHADHVRGREMVAEMGGLGDALAAGDADCAGRLADVMAAYTALLHAHIRREEDECFDAADRELSNGVQEALEADYERIERDVVGEGRHEAFHALLERLTMAYVD